jgi:hypothetical protein
VYRLVQDQEQNPETLPNLLLNLLRNLKRNLKQNPAPDRLRDLEQNLLQNLEQDLLQNLEYDLEQNPVENLKKNLEQNLKQNLRQGLLKKLGQNRLLQEAPTTKRYLKLADILLIIATFAGTVTFTVLLTITTASNSPPPHVKTPYQSRTAGRNVEPMTTVDMKQPFRPIPCFIHSQIVTV